MSTSRWAKVPVGPHSRRWNTVPIERTVLVVVHTVTALNRLNDLLTVFDSDRRVQLVCTVPGTSAVSAGVEEELASAGAVVLPWQQAIMTEFDLALSVHNSGNLHDIAAPLAVLSHGIGYSKYSNRKPETGNRTVYGLSVQSLVQDGVVVPSAIVLSHVAELDRLAESVPDAVPVAVVAGDPCYDRLITSLPNRTRYREVLGADERTAVVFVSSTWGPNSLFGRSSDLIARLLAELDMDLHVVCAALHPNVWYAHGPAQIRLWLADCLRAGLLLIPPAAGWQQALLAADVVVGDHGAVTGYAAALGLPTLLATFPEDDVVTSSAIGALGRTAPHLAVGRPLRPQLRSAMTARRDHQSVRDLTTSVPGESARLLRTTFYGLMNLSEPDTGPVLPTYDATELTPLHASVEAWWATTHGTVEGHLRLSRWPADVTPPPRSPTEALDRHLVVTAGHPRHDLYGLAAVVVVRQDGPTPAEVLADRPACRLVIQRHEHDHCQVTTRDGTSAAIWVDEPGLVDASVYASALEPLAAAGHDLPSRVVVALGSHSAILDIDLAATTSG